MPASETRQERSVLVVDDDPFFTALVRETLQNLSPAPDVLVAQNGQEAAEALDAQPVDLLITDVQMPVMDGFELLARVANQRLRMPVLVITAEGSHEDESKLRRFGADHYFEKPVDLDLLRELVSRLLWDQQQGHLMGFTVASVLQLIEIEQKTCRVLVRSGERVGTLDFVDGRLVDATGPDAEGAALHGDDAALEIFRWPSPSLDIQRPEEQPAGRISMSVTHLLLESARLADEMGAGDESLDSLASIGTGTFDLSQVQAMVAEGNDLAPHEWELLERVGRIHGMTGVGLLDVEGHFLGATESDEPMEALAGVARRLVQAADEAVTRLGETEAPDEMLVGSKNRWIMVFPATSERYLLLVLQRHASNPALIKHQLRAALTGV